jgi:SAM-dependent methyltransferase
MDQSTINWIDQIRDLELGLVLDIAGPFSGRVLEIGGGTGVQAAKIKAMGIKVESIDLNESSYRESRIFPIVEYDGKNIPFPDESFDLIFSSNVLEHVAHIESFQAEMMRVLKPGGRAVHVMPSHTWRLWSMATHYPGLARHVLLRRLTSHGAAQPDAQAAVPTRGRMASLLLKAVVPTRHGERGNWVTEFLFFRPTWWRRLFERTGWIVEKVEPVPLFYTGYSLIGSSLNFGKRRMLSSTLGSASTCFVLRKP